MFQASEEVIRYFEQAGTVRRITKNQIIYAQGDTEPNLYLIKQGRVRMFFIGENGKEVTYQIIGENQLFGESAFLSHAARPTTICAVNDVVLISCPVQRLSPFLQESGELCDAVLRLLTENYGFLCGQVKRLAMYDRFQRVASYLLDQTAEENQGLGIVDSTLPYTHEELGVCLNLNRVTVTKVLDRFAREGLVRLGRKQIQVINREKLRCYLQGTK